MDYLALGSDKLVRIYGVSNALTGAPITDASIYVTLENENGAPVDVLCQNLSAKHIGGGDYYVVFPPERVVGTEYLTEGEFYNVVIVITRASETAAFRKTIRKRVQARYPTGEELTKG